MAKQRGSQAYDVSHAPVAARGLRLTEDDLTAILTDCVAPILRDDDGVEEIKAMLVGVIETDFETEALEAILQSAKARKSWQIGEALAEAFLAEGKACDFPWPASRDLRDLKASLPGTDLVGFQQTGDNEKPHRLAFGEVKTSTDVTVPPNVMYGRHGLKAQLEDLRNARVTRDTLFLYLAFRARGTPWEGTFRDAAIRYLKDSSDIALFGVLIRDVPPDAGDLRARAKALANDCPASTVIALFAIYLPAQTIDTLVERITKINAEARHANN